MSCLGKQRGRRRAACWLAGLREGRALGGDCRSLPTKVGHHKACALLPSPHTFCLPLTAVHLCSSVAHGVQVWGTETPNSVGVSDNESKTEHQVGPVWTLAYAEWAVNPPCVARLSPEGASSVRLSVCPCAVTAGLFRVHCRPRAESVCLTSILCSPKEPARPQGEGPRSEVSQRSAVSSLDDESQCKRHQSSLHPVAPRREIIKAYERGGDWTKMRPKQV